MGLLDMLLGSQNSGSVGQLAQQFGLDPDKVGSVLQHLVPALSHGALADQTAQSPALLQAMQSGDHERYLDHPELLQQPQATAQGNGILQQLFGSKDVSNQVAENAAQKTGVSGDLIKKMLPLIAIMAMGALKRHAQQNNIPLTQNASGSGLMGALSSFMNPAGGSSGIGGELLSLLSGRNAGAL